MTPDGTSALEHYLTAVRRVIDAAAEASDEADLFGAALSAAIDSLGLSAAGVYLVDETGKRAELVAQRGSPMPRSELIREVGVAEEPFAAVFVRQMPWHIEDFPASPWAAMVSGVGSMAAVPLVAAGTVLGSLNAVTAIGDRSIADEEMQTLSAIGREVGHALVQLRLRDSFELTDAIVTRAAVPIVALDPEGAVLWVNAAAARLTGVEAGDVVGRGAMDPVREGGEDEWAAFISTVLRDGSATFESEVRLSSGPGHVDVTAVHLRRGVQDRVVCLLRDRSAERAVEAALRESESVYRSYIERFHGVAYRWMPATELPSLLEGAVEELTGYTPADFNSGRVRWFDIVHPEDLPRVEEAERLLLSTPGRAFNDEYRIVRRDGATRWVNDVCRRVDDGEGEAPVVHGSVYDITENKAAQERLLASEEKLRRIFNSTHEAILIHDREGRTIEANESLLRVYGVTPEEAMDLTVWDISAPDEEMVAKLPGFWERTLAGEPQLFDWKARRPRDGSVFDVEVYLVPLSLDGEEVVLANINDVTARKQAEREAFEAAARWRSTVEDVVAVMGAVVESRDPYTAGHERRVTQLAAAVALEMEMAGPQVEALVIAGGVHDIGKVAVPAEILTRPGRLSQLEFDIVKGHPATGADILARIDFGLPVAEIVRAHHERLDGSGYPDGLVGDEVPLAARLLAVADVIEAMASHRPYRPALGIEAALSEIRAGAGRLYDADVVTACERVFAAGFVFAD